MNITMNGQTRTEAEWLALRVQELESKFGPITPEERLKFGGTLGGDRQTFYEESVNALLRERGLK